MPQPLSDKDYVTFTRRWVWDTVENMSVDELKRFAIDALHEDMEEILEFQSQYFEDELIQKNINDIRIYNISNDENKIQNFKIIKE